MQLETIKLSDIKIPEFFKACPPKPDTLNAKRRYIRAGGHGPYVLLHNGRWLVDGYATYLAALEAGFESIACFYVDQLSQAGIDTNRNRRPSIWGEALSGPGHDYINILTDIDKAGRIMPGQVFMAVRRDENIVKLYYAKGMCARPHTWDSGEYNITLLPFQRLDY